MTALPSPTLADSYLPLAGGRLPALSRTAFTQWNVAAACVAVTEGRADWETGSHSLRLETGSVVFFQNAATAVWWPPRSPRLRGAWIAFGPGAAAEYIGFLVRRYGRQHRLEPHHARLRETIALASIIGAAPREQRRSVFHWLSGWQLFLDAHRLPLNRIFELRPDSPELRALSTFTVKSLATELGYSRTHISRRLKHCWGEDPSKVLARVRRQGLSSPPSRGVGFRLGSPPPSSLPYRHRDSILCSGWDPPHLRFSTCGEGVAPAHHTQEQGMVSTPRCTLIVSLRGEAIFETPTVGLRLKAGQCLFFKDRVVAHWRAGDRPWRRIWLQFEGARAVALFDALNRRHGHLVDLPPTHALVRRARRIVRWVRAGRRGPGAFWSWTAFDWLLSFEEYLETQSPRGRRPLWVLSPLPEPPRPYFHSIQEVRETYGRSLSTLYPRLKQMWRATPGAVLREHRLKHAAELLRGGRQPVSEVARAVGHRSVPAFIAAFKKRYGVTPLAYRHTHR